MTTTYSAHRSAVIDEGAVIGDGTRIWHFCHVMTGSVIGEKCVLGQNVAVGPDVTIEDDVFCGPSAVFTNVRNPRAFVERKSEFRPTLVKRGATIGANATIVCGCIIGEYAMIGAGAVVTRDVAPHALVVGCPARLLGWVGRSGERLGDDLVCPRTGERYVRENGTLRLL